MLRNQAKGEPMTTPEPPPHDDAKPPGKRKVASARRKIAWLAVTLVGLALLVLYGLSSYKLYRLNNRKLLQIETLALFSNLIQVCSGGSN